MVKVKVPATSANIGSGFDACGLALSHYNIVSVQQSDVIDITTTDSSTVPTGNKNLIYHTVKSVYTKFGKQLNGLKIVQENNIPMTRGLGSSSACIVAGILAANELLGNVLTKNEMLELATKIEGHPDNVAPALLGGFVTSVYDEGKVYSVKKVLPDDLRFAVFIPNFKLATTTARQVLPKEIPHSHAVFNLARSALLSAALCENRFDLLKVATKDMVHQQYRLPLIKGGEDVFDLANSLGALATYISGAGPTILSIVEKSNKKFFEQAQTAVNEDKRFKSYSFHSLKADNSGAVVYLNNL